MEIPHTRAFILLMPVTKKFVLLSNRIVFRMDLCFRLSGFITAYIYISLSERLIFRAYKEFRQARLIRLFKTGCNCCSSSRLRFANLSTTRSGMFDCLCRKAAFLQLLYQRSIHTFLRMQIETPRCRPAFTQQRS
jgi:hypothetical protein